MAVSCKEYLPLFHEQDFHGLLGAQHLIFAQRSLYVYDFQIVRIYLELSAWIGRRKGNSQPLDYQMASFHTMKGAEKITPQAFLAYQTARYLLCKWKGEKSPKF
jgi:hypothetical protein